MIFASINNDKEHTLFLYEFMYHNTEHFQKLFHYFPVRFLQETDHDWAYWSIDGYKYPGKNTFIQCFFSLTYNLFNSNQYLPSNTEFFKIMIFFWMKTIKNTENVNGERDELFSLSF
jgi:hypothetical protein